MITYEAAQIGKRSEYSSVVDAYLLDDNKILVKHKMEVLDSRGFILGESYYINSLYGYNNNGNIKSEYGTKNGLEFYTTTIDNKTINKIAKDSSTWLNYGPHFDCEMTIYIKDYLLENNYKIFCDNILQKSKIFTVTYDDYKQLCDGVDLLLVKTNAINDYIFIKQSESVYNEYFLRKRSKIYQKPYLVAVKLVVIPFAVAADIITGPFQILLSALVGGDIMMISNW